MQGSQIPEPMILLMAMKRKVIGDFTSHLVDNIVRFINFNTIWNSPKNVNKFERKLLLERFTKHIDNKNCIYENVVMCTISTKRREPRLFKYVHIKSILNTKVWLCGSALWPGLSHFTFLGSNLFFWRIKLISVTSNFTNLRF